MVDKTSKVICVVCPRSCVGTIVQSGDKIISTDGFLCARGKKYGSDEVTAPKRMLTTTVKIDNAVLPLLPVVSKTGVPKDSVIDCARCLSAVKVKAPVKAGEVIVADIMGTGVDVIASRDMDIVLEQ